jgi:hypothetical protein
VAARALTLGRIPIFAGARSATDVLFVFEPPRECLQQPLSMYRVATLANLFGYDLDQLADADTNSFSKFFSITNALLHCRKEADRFACEASMAALSVSGSLVSGHKICLLEYNEHYPREKPKR